MKSVIRKRLGLGGSASIDRRAITFAVCMTCHGELARGKPDAAHLTLFYLIISVGGAFGGLFTALIAPRVFTGFFEFQIGLAAAVALLVVCLVRDGVFDCSDRRPRWALYALLCICTMFCTALGKQVFAADATQVTSARNFYGVLRVVKRPHETVTLDVS